MARPPALTVDLIDEVGRVKQSVDRLVMADGVVTQDEALLQSEMRYLASLARDVDEARLCAISYLDHGQLMPRRVRRLREIATENNDPEAA